MEPDSATLDRYLAGDCTPEEATAIRQWLTENPTHATGLAEVAEVREVVGRSMVWRTDAVWSSLSARIARTEGAPSLESSEGVLPAESSDAASMHHRRRRVGEFPGKQNLPIASRRRASLLWSSWTMMTGLGVGVAAFILVFIGGILQSTSHPKASSQAVYATPRGARANIELPDGSRVLLNTESTLQFVMNEHGRRVTLTGEALFTVTHSQTPFVVLAGNVRTAVLGTTFSVRRYGEDTVTRVVVADGKVSVADTVLAAGDMAWRGARGGMRVVRGVAIETALAWTKGALVFTKIPLAEALRDVERWYGIPVRLVDPALAERRVTVSFVDESAREAIDVLAMLTGAQVEWHNGAVTLYSRQDKP